MVAYNGNIYVFGGAANSASTSRMFKSAKLNAVEEITLNDLWAYVDSDKVWREEKPVVTPPKRKGHSANVWNGKMIVYGGEQSGGLLNDLWAYDFTTQTWTQMPVGGTPPKVADHASEINGDFLVIAGGKDSMDTSCDNVVQINLNETSSGFTSKPDLPEPLQSGEMYYLNDYFYFLGGIWNDWDSSTPGDQPSYSMYMHRISSTCVSWGTITPTGAVQEVAKFGGVYIPGLSEYYIIGGEKYDYTNNKPVQTNKVIKVVTTSNAWSEVLHDSDNVGLSQLAAVYLPKDSGSSNNRYFNNIKSSSSGYIYYYGGLDKNGIISSGFYKMDISSNAITKLNSLAAPAGISASAASPAQIIITWTDNNTSETGYKIERKTGTGSYAVIDTAAQNSASYTDNSVSEGISYTYRIMAISTSGGYSDYSSEAAAVTYLNTPTGLTLTNLANGNISLSWVDNSQNESGYIIQRRTESGTYTQLASVAQDVNTYTDASSAVGTKYYYKVKAFNSVAESEYSNETNMTPVGNDDCYDAIPKEYALYQNFPNPFNPSTRILFKIPEGGVVKISLYDMLGREVQVIMEEELSAGRHIITFNASGLPSGTYIYKITAGAFNSVKKMIFMK